MNADRDRAKSIFLNAVELASADRAAYLDAVCGGDPVLRSEIDVLLAHYGKAADFLDEPPLNMDVTVDRPTATEIIGQSIGPYRLLQQIGEGGMGTVYMAQQSAPIHRKVALKVIKPGMDSRQILARFEAERQALAMMDHVNIARVLDCGTTTGSPGGVSAGRPYFVMELVHGVPINKYCDDNRLTPRQRLELFVPVCHAIQHAHQKGIIHRDIKPSNVMVTLYDGRPVPKVIDFGVAKATEQKLTERTLFTQYGTIVGTLEYMSPEQAEMSALGVDTRSDIYSLGVLLYELLTGSTPLTHQRMKEVAYVEILRMIKEVDPPKPSTRLSDSGEALASISANRHTEPAKLTKLVRGELDWIVMKCLEKDRNRRYETANAFAADVHRYLADEPVQACPPTLGYRFRKFVRHYRGSVITAATILLALIGGVIGTTWGMVRATLAETEAVSEAQQKTTALGEKEAALTDAKNQLFQALVQQARAERSSGRVGQRFESLKAIQAAARIRITPALGTEATAALVLPDAEVVEEWEGMSAHISSFDNSLQRYTRVDIKGRLTVCRRINGREEILTTLPDQGNWRYWGVHLSPNGRYVAAGYGPTNSMKGHVLVWKVDASEPVALHPESPGIYEYAYAFHPNGQQFAVGHVDQTVDVYDLATGKKVHHLKASAKPFWLVFHPREHKLAVAADNCILLFDTITGKEIPTLRYLAGVTQTYSLSWHPDGRRLAAGCNDRKIHLWDTQTATEIASPWVGHSNSGLVVAFNETGDQLISSDWGGQTRIWDTASGRELLDVPFSGRFSSDGRIAAVHIIGGKVKFWRLAGGSEFRVLRPRKAGKLDPIVTPVVFPDGRTLAAATVNEICFFDLIRGEELASAKLPKADGARPVFFDPPFPRKPSKSGEQGDRPIGLMTGGHLGLNHWPVRSSKDRPERWQIGPPEQITPNPGGGFSAGARSSADGRVVAVPQGHSTLVLFRDKPGRRLILGPQFDVRHCAVSPEGRWVVTCGFGWDGQSSIHWIWDAYTDARSPVAEVSHGSIAKATFSPDGRWLMTADSSGTRQLEVGTWREVRRFDQTAPSVFSPDSRLLAVSDTHSVIRLLESETGREVARLTGPDRIHYVPACFTPDGTRLVADSNAGTALYVWDLRLIRQQLKKLDLDWDWPEFPPAAPDLGKTLHVEIDLGGGITTKLWDDLKSGRGDQHRFREKMLDGELTNAFAKKKHTIEMQAGKTYVFDLESAAFDPILTLERLDGGLLAVNDDISEDNLNARIIFTAPITAPCDLSVTPYKVGSAGRYTLRIREWLAGK